MFPCVPTFCSIVSQTCAEVSADSDSAGSVCSVRAGALGFVHPTHRSLAIELFYKVLPLSLMYAVGITPPHLANFVFALEVCVCGFFLICFCFIFFFEWDLCTPCWP